MQALNKFTTIIKKSISPENIRTIRQDEELKTFDKITKLRQIRDMNNDDITKSCQLLYKKLKQMCINNKDENSFLNNTLEQFTKDMHNMVPSNWTVTESPFFFDNLIYPDCRNKYNKQFNPNYFNIMNEKIKSAKASKKGIIMSELGDITKLKMHVITVIEKDSNADDTKTSIKKLEQLGSVMFKFKENCKKEKHTSSPNKSYRMKYIKYKKKYICLKIQKDTHLPSTSL